MRQNKDNDMRLSGYDIKIWFNGIRLYYMRSDDIRYNQIRLNDIRRDGMRSDKGW